MVVPLYRKIRIIAQDPSVRTPDKKILTGIVDVPYEEIAAGPRGYRIHVIDYDASAGKFYHPVPLKELEKEGMVSEEGVLFEGVSDEALLDNPQFHAMNTYAIIMRTLAAFESALGRRVSWSFGGHQIKVAPHAFADANAFYSKRDEGLFFGYFPDPDEEKKMVFTCLSHDVIVHETTHGLVDGLRQCYIEPETLDQVAFHEGFADVVALLSVFSVPEVVELLIDQRPETDAVKKAIQKKAQIKSTQEGSRKNGAQESSRNKDIIDI
ncbi:hypothetical protein ACFLU6_13990, partial [Acidobacteriota bacterium]